MLRTVQNVPNPKQIRNILGDQNWMLIEVAQEALDTHGLDA